MEKTVTLGNIGEKKLVEMILEYVDEVDNGLEKDDDIAVVQGIALKIDGFSTYNSMLPWNTYYDMGWKSVIMVISDFIAKGVKPLAIMVSIGATRETPVNDIIEIIKGIRESAHYYDVKFVGGDTNASKSDVWIDASGIGLPVNKVISRKGAKAGDYVLVTGSFGLTGAAFHAYLADYDLNSLKEKYPEIIKATKQPLAPKFFLEIVGKYRECISSSIDISDGLAFSLGQLASKNKLSIHLIDLPIHYEAIKYAHELNLDPGFLALYGGEEFQILFTIRRECENVVQSLIRDYDVTLIGFLKKGKGVYYNNREIKPVGWDHFQNLYKNTG